MSEIAVETEMCGDVPARVECGLVGNFYCAVCGRGESVFAHWFKGEYVGEERYWLVNGVTGAEVLVPPVLAAEYEAGELTVDDIASSAALDLPDWPDWVDDCHLVKR
ncbi:hypothetical protein [Bifidobacterium eulemuris]|uniref:Uncharacterized protein n=1 Tax=Bifidobacterium eulemuris TaxID=1765219 RepID=A0A261GA18_9BIFI|nr:hypothetical protein [Bifidobacterium eulemuris]OZG68254.1 hypothetical protein BEUL_1267 [Bifidobacterium eulemuris]QOL31690.1 hypothetical protein BE0216_03855 [Bifidobacterium eulemuris]